VPAAGKRRSAGDDAAETAPSGGSGTHRAMILSKSSKNAWRCEDVTEPTFRIAARNKLRL
jgi:hypothetical protein